MISDKTRNTTSLALQGTSLKNQIRYLAEGTLLADMKLIPRCILNWEIQIHVP